MDRKKYKTKKCGKHTRSISAKCAIQRRCSSQALLSTETVIHIPEISGKLETPEHETADRSVTTVSEMLETPSHKTADDFLTNVGEKLETPMQETADDSLASVSGVKESTILEKPEPLLKDAWGTDEEYERTMAHDLAVEIVNDDDYRVLYGNRIVDIHYVLKWSINLRYDHSKRCTAGLILPIHEERYATGLVSIISVYINKYGLIQLNHQRRNQQ